MLVEEAFRLWSVTISSLTTVPSELRELLPNAAALLRRGRDAAALLPLLEVRGDRVAGGELGTGAPRPHDLLPVRRTLLQLLEMKGCVLALVSDYSRHPRLHPDNVLALVVSARLAYLQLTSPALHLHLQ